MFLRICIWALVLLVGPAWSQFELKVGRDGLSWLVAQDSLAFVNMAPDSLWTWPVAPGENLLANALGRGGRILVSVLQESFNPFGEPILWPVSMRWCSRSKQPAFPAWCSLPA